MKPQFNIKIFKGLFLSFLIVGLIGYFFIVTRKQITIAAPKVEDKKVTKNVELTLTSIKPVPASDTNPNSIEVTSTLYNNLPFPISYQSGCGVGPILYVRAQQTGTTYKISINNTDINSTNSNSCLAQENIVASLGSQTLTIVYQLNGLDSYHIEQGMTYTIHLTDKKNRYKKLDDRAVMDNFPIKRIRSNEVAYSDSNTQNTISIIIPSNTPAPTATPTGAATAFLNPNANSVDTGGDGNGFASNPSRAYTSNSSYAVDNNSGSGNSTNCTGTDKDRHRYYNYNIAIPAGTAATGIEVRLIAKVDSSSNSPKMCVQLSWNGGTTWTTSQLTPNLSTSKTTYTLGGAGNVWGRTWNNSEFSNSNFRLRVINIASSTSRDFSLDWAAVKVYYNAVTPTSTPTQPTPTKTPTPTPTLTPTLVPSTSPTASIPYPQNSLVGPFNPKVLVIDYNTTGTPADGSEALTSQLIQALQTASKHHNNSFSSATFSVYQRHVENNAPPMVSATRADYQAIFTNYNICTLVETQGINFVWIWVHENYADKFLEWVTTGPTFYQTYGTNVPTCGGHTVVTLGLNYNTSVANALHSYGHYMENVGYYAFGPVDFDNIDATDMWDLFDGQAPRYRSFTGPVNTTSARCGNVHFLPNTAQVYDYGNNTTVQSSCATYNPGNPSALVYVPINQATWMQQVPCDPSIQNNLGACQTYSYLAWWMQNMPGYNNAATDLNHDPMPNWWQYFVSLDSTIRYN